MSSFPNPAPGRALRLTWPFGRTLVLAALLLLLAAGAAEGLARVPAVRSHLALNTTDNPDPHFDELLYELDQHAAEQGRVDCVVLGNSLAFNGFLATTFAAAYRQTGAGEPPDCFRFALPGLTAQQAGRLARLLAQRYHPRLLIYTTSARDFTLHPSASGYTSANDLTNATWFRYRLGEGFSLEGWLIEHSLAYRAATVFRRWLQTEPPSGVVAPRADLTKPPDPITEALLFALLADYQPSAAGLDGLAQILDLRAQGIRVIVVEMPVHATLLLALPNGAADLERFRAAVQQPTLAAGAEFWSAEVELTPALTDNDFYDRLHLNDSGRTAFSTWLANKLAANP